MPVYLEGLSLEFFRGIGTVQTLGPFKDFNLFVGANNTGKSTVLDFLYRHLPTSHNKSERPKPPIPLDRHFGRPTGNLQFHIGVSPTRFQKLIEAQVNQTYLTRFRSSITAVVSALTKNDIVWIQANANQQYSIVHDPQALMGVFADQSEWQALWSYLTGSGRGELKAHWIPQTSEVFAGAQNLDLPRVRLIPTNRQIGSTAENFEDFSGRGLIARLAEIQSPDHDKRYETELFDSINRFLQTVTGREAARIEIPHNRQHILVHMDDKVLPLASLGTGIHEVIMIAAFCTISQKEIVCIEEPETHLHPLLQRKLLAYLQSETTNQYFIATHSPSFIDTPKAAIFHVTNDGGCTSIRETILRGERFAICSDLGIRASDIVQSNFVVWVEGPSDRIYLRHWIKAVDSGLVEGIHYSIMFYGGRLLSHLSAEEDEVTEFIRLRSLNQNLSIVMDSDRNSADSPINATKQRLKEEFEKGGSLAWVTMGREIENYVSYPVLQAAVKSLYEKSYHSPGKGDLFDHALHFYPASADGKKSRTPVTTVDKVRVARAITEQETDLSILDLKHQIADLVARIRTANF